MNFKRYDGLKTIFSEISCYFFDEQKLIVKRSKNTSHIMVWGAISGIGISKLHVVPPRKTIDGHYYRHRILPAFLRDLKSRSTSENVLKV
jgi:hypothetical protein